MNDLKKKEFYEVTNNLSDFEKYLTQFGLPSQNVIACSESRNNLANLLPNFLMSLPEEERKDARYLSKFITAGAIGLYDASLNYLWDEVILNLRKKVIAYGLEYFYDMAVGGTNRDSYKTEEDLPRVKDTVLLTTCKKIELLDETLYKKLSFILDMRNNIGASHPNEYEISEYELMSYLEVCVKKVLSTKVSSAAITIKSICDNLEKRTTALSDGECKSFENSIQMLSTEMSSNFLRRLFGMFTSSSNDGNATLLQNIMKIAQIIWKYSNEESKYSIGEKIDVFTVNLDDKKAKQGELFLEKCNGKNYYTKSTKCIKLATLCESLENAHNGYDNYSNEVPFAREIMSMIKSFDDIPIERQERLLSLFLKCRCGNGYDYCRGVSPNGKKYYDALFTMIDDENFKMIIAILKDNSHYMYGKNRTNNLKEILTIVRNNIISERLLEIIDAMLEFDKDDLDMLFKTKAFGEKISFI